MPAGTLRLLTSPPGPLPAATRLFDESKKMKKKKKNEKREGTYLARKYIEFSFSADVHAVSGHRRVTRAGPNESPTIEIEEETLQ